MVRVSGNMDPFLARPFGISSIPFRSSIEIIYRIAGRGTRLLSGVEPGKSLRLLGPLGNGFPLHEKNTVPVLVGGGSGFPPLHFLARRVAAGGHFLIGARSRECLPPVPVLKSFRDKGAKVLVATEDGSAGTKGMTGDILDSFLAKMKQKHRFVVYACGPHAMLAAVSRISAAYDVRCYVSMEERMACGLGACMGCSIPQKAGGYKRACKEGPVFDANDIDWSERVVLPMPHLKK